MYVPASFSTFFFLSITNLNPSSISVALATTTMSTSTSTTSFQLRQPIWIFYSSAAAVINSITVVELLVVRGSILSSLSICSYLQPQL
ncbi:uncharacterized protein DS421_2g45050 [Arachis hypogaea]|nr:uncharacterized protein DS421_2g45050 [Arachis hypogaea]